jgi:hypothetical protein
MNTDKGNGMKHKHSDVIKAFADGIECEFLGEHSNKWLNIKSFETFDLYETVRIKPEPKPDVVLFGYASEEDIACLSVLTNGFDNIKLTFDGETCKLNSAEVIK